MKYLAPNPTFNFKAAKRFWKRHSAIPIPTDPKEIFRGPPIDHLRQNSPFKPVEIKISTATPEYIVEKSLARKVWFWEYFWRI